MKQISTFVVALLCAFALALALYQPSSGADDRGNTMKREMPGFHAMGKLPLPKWTPQPRAEELKANIMPVVKIARGTTGQATYVKTFEDGFVLLNTTSWFIQPSAASNENPVGWVAHDAGGEVTVPLNANLGFCSLTNNLSPTLDENGFQSADYYEFEVVDSVVCGPGTHDDGTGNCIPDTDPPTCAAGFYWNGTECVPTPTGTPEPTATATPVPTNTPVPTATPEPTPEPTNTPVPTPDPTATPVPTATPTPTATPNPTATPTPTPEPGGSARVYSTSSEADLTSLDGGADENAEEPRIVSEKAWVVGEITLSKKTHLAPGQTALKIKVEDQWENAGSNETEPTPDEPEFVKNRAFLQLPLANTDTDKFKVQWRKATLKDGALGEWSDGSPLDGNDTDGTVVYRGWIDFKPDAAKKFDGAIGGWDTTVGIVDLDPETSALTGGEDANTLFSANGVHQVGIEKVEGGNDKKLLIANPTEADPDGKKEVEVTGEAVDVENLTITEVSTNAGNPDYLLFDPAEDADETLQHPLIKFKIEDKGEKHKYVWTIKVNDTNLDSWKKKATVRGVADAPGEIEVHLNDDDWLADHGQTQDAHLEDWGTYSFDIFVAEVKGDTTTTVTNDVEGDPFSAFSLPRVDYYAFKQGGKDGRYFLTIPKDAAHKRHYVQPKWEEKNGKIRDFFEAGYFLQDKLSKPASKVWFDLYSPRLTQKGSTVDLANTALDTDSHQEVFAATVPIEDDEDWSAADETHTFIGIFMALDSHAERRRDHKPAHTLAVNDRPKEEATFQFEKIHQDGPTNKTWGPIGEAIYTGSIASTADNIKIKAYPKSRKPILHANWFMTWGKTAQKSEDNKFPKEIFRVPQAKKADAGAKSVSVALDLFPSDQKPRAGFYRFGCVLRFKDGTVGEAVSRPIRVGVRTDDAIVFGWINPSGIRLPSATEATGDITGILPRKGLAAGNNKRVPNINTAQTALDLSTSTSANKRLNALYKLGRAALVLGQLSECKDNPTNPTGQVLVSLYVDITKLMPTGYDPNRLKFGDVFSANTPTNDRKYALYWQFKYAANDPAKSSVPRTSKRVRAYDFKDVNRQAIDYNRLGQFSNLRQSNWVTQDPVLGTVASKIPNIFLPTIGAVELGKGGTVYKMLNHFQVRYLLDRATGTKIESMQPLTRGMKSTWNGVTADPLTEIAGLHGQAGPLEGKINRSGGPKDYRNAGVIRQTNNGSPDVRAVKAFDTLSKGLDAFWEDIGSQIYFEQGKFEPTMIAQAYPTYEMFVNGDYAKTDPQAKNPIGHFYHSPYPFGRGKTSGLFGSFQGGRNGKSIGSPAVHPSARKAPIEEGMPR